MSAKGRGHRAEHALLAGRKAMVKELRERYAVYGDRLVQYLCEKSGQRGGLRVALSKVLRPLPLEEKAMHDALLRFLNTEGVSAFFDRVGESSASDITPAPSIEEDTDLEALEPGYRPRIIPPEPTASQAALAPAAPPAETEPDEVEEPPVEIEPDEVDDGLWDGTERRSGFERRSGRDRRKDCQVVFKNRRYGGDRRSGLERRSGLDLS
jgi:hypothetical protein